METMEFYSNMAEYYLIKAEYYRGLSQRTRSGLFVRLYNQNKSLFIDYMDKAWSQQTTIRYHLKMQCHSLTSSLH